MATLPELLEEDVQQINSVLRDFLTKSEATVALVAAEGGFLVTQVGDLNRFDTTTLSALAANGFSAAQAIASLVQEKTFTHIYQQGESFSLLVSSIDGFNTMIVLFPGQVSVGAVKYFASSAIEKIGQQLQKAQERPSNNGIDLAMLNLPDSTVIFTRRD